MPFPMHARINRSGRAQARRDRVSWVLLATLACLDAAGSLAAGAISLFLVFAAVAAGAWWRGVR